MVGKSASRTSGFEEWCFLQKYGLPVIRPLTGRQTLRGCLLKSESSFVEQEAKGVQAVLIDQMRFDHKTVG